MYLRSLMTVATAAVVVVVLSAFALAGWGGGRARADEPATKKPSVSPVLNHLRPGSPSIDAAKPCPVGPGSVTYGTGTRPVEAPKPAQVKRWYQLVGQPGWYGYGALNARGEVVVEQRRYCANGACRYR